MNEHLLERKLLEALRELEQAGVSVGMSVVSRSAIGKSSAPFLSSVRECTIKLIPPADWGMQG